VLDQRLSGLRHAQAQRDETRHRLAALDQPEVWDECSLQSSARAAMLYQAWADARRRELNLNLARQTIKVINAEEASREAFGRQVALKRITQRG
jgi:hypothetical protein